MTVGPAPARTIATGCVTLGMFLWAACGAAMAADPAPLEAETASSPAGRRPLLLLTGDAFFRYEAVRDAPTDDFERARLRLRPGLEATLGSGRLLHLGAGALASLASDSNAENEIRRDNFVSDELTVDRAYVRFAAPQSVFSATIGLAPSPFEGTEVLWDRDIRFSGVHAGAELPVAGPLMNHRVYGGVTVGSQDHEDESLAAAVRWEGETGRFSIGAAFWHFDRTSELIEAGYARTNRLAPGGEEFLSDFEVVNVSVGWEWLGEHRPLRLRLDLLFNAGADDRRTGGDLRVDWGELQELGTWRLRLQLQRVEQDATLAAFGGDEWWFRTGQRGARLAFALALHRRAFVEIGALSQRRDDQDVWLDRAMLDLVFLM